LLAALSATTPAEPTASAPPSAASSSAATANHATAVAAARPLGNSSDIPSMTSVN
jgi:hypothetical protein